MMLMHASLIISTIPAPNGILEPAVTGASLLTYYAVLAGALWFLVAAVNFGRRQATLLITDLFKSAQDSGGKSPKVKKNN